jgi:hypothetical protein
VDDDDDDNDNDELGFRKAAASECDMEMAARIIEGDSFILV